MQFKNKIIMMKISFFEVFFIANLNKKNCLPKFHFKKIKYALPAFFFNNLQYDFYFYCKKSRNFCIKFNFFLSLFPYISLQKNQPFTGSALVRGRRTRCHCYRKAPVKIERVAFSLLRNVTRRFAQSNCRLSLRGGSR